MARRTQRTVWTVVYPDPQNIAGLGVAYFESRIEAEGFAAAVTAHTVREESVPIRIADRWTFTRWGRS